VEFFNIRFLVVTGRDDADKFHHSPSRMPRERFRIQEKYRSVRGGTLGDAG